MNLIAALTMNWLGDKLIDRARGATTSGVNESTDAMAEDARGNAPVLTGYYRDNITSEPAHQEGNTIVGRLLGQAEYSLWIDVGSQGRPGQHVLRNAFDAHAKGLASKIKDNFGGVT